MADTDDNRSRERGARGDDTDWRRGYDETVHNGPPSGTWAGWPDASHPQRRNVPTREQWGNDTGYDEQGGGYGGGRDFSDASGSAAWYAPRDYGEQARWGRENEGEYRTLFDSSVAIDADEGTPGVRGTAAPFERDLSIAGRFGPEDTGARGDRFGGTDYGANVTRERGKPPKGYQRSDQRIREEICEWLADTAHIDSSEVTVEVKDRVVTLDGTVPDRRMKHAIEDMAADCAGVEDVDNRIRVVPSAA